MLDYNIILFVVFCKNRWVVLYYFTIDNGYKIFVFQDLVLKFYKKCSIDLIYFFTVSYNYSAITYSVKIKKRLHSATKKDLPQIK